MAGGAGGAGGSWLTTTWMNWPSKSKIWSGTSGGSGIALAGGADSFLWTSFTL
jgi:hypothetical protein